MKAPYQTMPARSKINRQSLVQDGIVDLAAEDAAQTDGEHQAAGVFLVADLVVLHGLAQLPIRRKQAQHQHHAEGADGERADME